LATNLSSAGEKFAMPKNLRSLVAAVSDKNSSVEEEAPVQQAFFLSEDYPLILQGLRTLNLSC
jgi:hypothetical protein